MIKAKKLDNTSEKNIYYIPKQKTLEMLKYISSFDIEPEDRELIGNVLNIIEVLKHSEDVLVLHLDILQELNEIWKKYK